MESSPTVSVESLPTGSSVTFKCSSFFVRNGKDAALPTPTEVLATCAVQSPTLHKSLQPPPVIFENLGLLVKFGREPNVHIAEGQCLWALRHVLPSVPVAEIYGWTQEAGLTYLYMELVPGITLKNIWSSLSNSERTQICTELRYMVKELRHLRQEGGQHFIGLINRDPLTDVVFTNGVLPRAGPFAGVKEFHDWLSKMIIRGKGQHWPGIHPDDIPDPCRKGLPDDAEIVFTHCDLHRGNIIISQEKPHRIAAIIDWGLAGWYPDYWEFCKAEYTAEAGSEWMEVFIPQFVDEPECVITFELYAKGLGY